MSSFFRIQNPESARRTFLQRSGMYLSGTAIALHPEPSCAAHGRAVKKLPPSATPSEPIPWSDASAPAQVT